MIITDAKTIYLLALCLFFITG